MADSLAARLAVNEETKFNASAVKNNTGRGRKFCLQKFLTGLAGLVYLYLIFAGTPDLISYKTEFFMINVYEVRGLWYAEMIDSWCFCLQWMSILQLLYMTLIAISCKHNGYYYTLSGVWLGIDIIISYWCGCSDLILVWKLLWYMHILYMATSFSSKYRPRPCPGLRG